MHTGIHDNHEEKLKRRRKIATMDKRLGSTSFRRISSATRRLSGCTRRIPRSLLAAAAICRKNAENG